MSKIDINKMWSALKKKKEQSFKTLKARHIKFTAALVKLEKEKKALEKAGVEFGKPNWKSQITKSDGSRKEYLRILYVGDKVRYIGCKKENVEKAMADIERGVRVRKLESMIRDTRYNIDDIINEIRSL